jgi:hypothetical protein
MKTGTVGIMAGFFLVLTAIATGFESRSRVTQTEPSRFGSLATTKKTLKWTVIDGSEYVNIGEVAVYLGLKNVWIERIAS